jgi:hypothetical protein
VAARLLGTSLVSVFVVTAALAQAPAGSAATVTVRNDRHGQLAMYYDAAPGERNDGRR